SGRSDAVSRATSETHGSGSGLGGVDVGREGLLGDLDQGVERVRVRHRKVSEDAAVNLDTSGVEPLDETVVGHSLGADRSVDALDPQPAEVSLARLAVAVGVDHRVSDLLLRLAVQARALAAVTGGPLEG